MKNYFIIYLLIFSLNVFAQQESTIKTYQLPLIEIVSKKQIPFVNKYEYSTDYNSTIFYKNGYSLIRRGMNFTQDLYVEGYKRGNVKIVIDGEHYHNACPNRMDAPATRLNMIDLSEIELTKSAALIGTGLYGKIEYHRSKLEDNLRLKSIITGNYGAQKDYDASFSVGALFTNLSVRYSSGVPYENGESKSFKDLYGYQDNNRFYFTNVTIRKAINNYGLEFGGSFTHAKDISFPYLQMDERKSKVFNGFIAYKGNKLYFNFTDHLMNNGLRTNFSKMQMETDAKNLTIGLTGDFYEFIYRNWNANNYINMPMMGMFISNKLMPNVDHIGLNLSKEFVFDQFKTYVKGGVHLLRYKDDSRSNFYKELFPDTKQNRLFFSLGLLGSYSKHINKNLIFMTTAELATEAPEAEQLFIAVNRPMSNPDWSGNPTLKNPVRVSLRTTVILNPLSIELFGNYNINYIEVVKKMKSMKPAMTYDNVNAIIAGTNVTLSYKWIESVLSYTWGENIKSKSPLAEIAPLSLITTIKTPDIMGIKFIFSHRYENAQTRINEDLKEFKTAAWNTISLGVQYTYSYITLFIQGNNLLNHNYVRYLSYSRNPFSAGIPVYEPGRSINFTLSMNKLY